MGGIWGQDWASYQSPTPDTTGLSFAFVKVTEGLSYINPEWRSQRDHAKANGLVWGAYHYPHMHNSDRAEADYFLAQVNWQPGDMLVLDWEGYDTANQSVSAADQLAYKEDYLQYLKSRMPHNPVGTYMNVDYLNRVDTTGHVGDFLWIATAGRAAGQPGISAPWLFHQYSDQPLDSDYCHLGSTAELRAWALSFAANPQEDNMPLTDADAELVAQHVWGHTETNADTGQPVYMGSVMAWMDKIHNRNYNATQAVAAQLTATQAAVTALANQLGQVHGVDTAAVIAAVQKAIADATVHVQVAVTGTPAPAPTA